MASCNYYYWKCHMHRANAHKIKPYKMSPSLWNHLKLHPLCRIRAYIHDMIAMHSTDERIFLLKLKSARVS